MAKNVGRLAGLAALGAAAYMMSKGKDKESSKGKEDTGAGYKSTETGRMSDEDKAEMKRETQRGPIAQFPSKKVESTPVIKREVKSEDLPSVETLKPVSEPSDKSIKLAPENRDLEAKMSRGTREEPKPVSTVSSSEEGMKNYKPRRTPKASTVSSSEAGMKNYVPRRAPAPATQIPGQSRSGPTGGERVSGTELSRNVSNTLSALTPLGGGVGKIGAELATTNRAQRAYNAAQAERRAAEGMSPAEALAAKQAAAQAAREAKTLNPNAWMAGPKGMAENFRKGGAVKKMASGGMTASKRADGIASRGKTRCKMY